MTFELLSAPQQCEGHSALSARRGPAARLFVWVTRRSPEMMAEPTKRVWWFQRPLGNWQQRKRNIEAIPEIAAQVCNNPRPPTLANACDATTRAVVHGHAVLLIRKRSQQQRKTQTSDPGSAPPSHSAHTPTGCEEEEHRARDHRC
jgi:hypothetical protein